MYIYTHKYTVYIHIPVRSTMVLHRVYSQRFLSLPDFA